MRESANLLDVDVHAAVHEAVDEAEHKAVHEPAPAVVDAAATHTELTDTVGTPGLGMHAPQAESDAELVAAVGTHAKAHRPSVRDIAPGIAQYSLHSLISSAHWICVHVPSKSTHVGQFGHVFQSGAITEGSFM